MQPTDQLKREIQRQPEARLPISTTGCFLRTKILLEASSSYSRSINGKPNNFRGSLVSNIHITHHGGYWANNGSQAYLAVESYSMLIEELCRVTLGFCKDNVCWTNISKLQLCSTPCSRFCLLLLAKTVINPHPQIFTWKRKGTKGHSLRN